MEATFAGPSCDSLDIMFRGKLTVRQEVGDLLLVPSCGCLYFGFGDDLQRFQ